MQIVVNTASRVDTIFIRDAVGRCKKRHDEGRTRHECFQCSRESVGSFGRAMSRRLVNRTILLSFFFLS